MKKFFLIPLMALCSCVMAFAGNGQEKFYFGITSGNTVGASVYDGLNLQLQVPADGTVDMSSVTVAARMQNVPSLGVTTQRTQTVTINTGLSGTANLTSWFNHAYAFDGTNMVVSVKGEGATQSFLYTFNSINANGVIKATPNSEEAAMAAWNLLASQVTAATKAQEDTYILFKEGSYIQMGGEKMTFTTDHEFLKGDWQSAGLNGAVNGLLNATSVATANAGNVIFIAKGSVLAIGNSIATTEKDVTITLTNDATDQTVLNGKLSAMRTDMQGNDLKPVIKDVVNLFNDILGYIDAADVNYLHINFGETGEVLAPEEAEEPEMGVKTLIRGGVTPGYFYTVCIPYGVDSYVGGTFYEINYKDGDNLELVSVNSLAAGTPYVLVPTTTEVEGYFNTNHVDQALSNRGLVGTFESIQLSGTTNNYYVFGNTAIQPCANICFLAANRAYIDMNNVPAQSQSEAQLAGRRRISVGPNYVPTAIDEVSAEAVKGMKKIENGQLVIIRDGVKYNAQGAVIE